MPDFSRRSLEEEMMDDFSLGHEIIDPIMDELEVVNKLLGGYNVFFDAFEKIGLKDGMIISDWGCGGGDSLRVIAKWARRRNLKIHLVGVDANESAIEYARKRSGNFPEISYILTDVMSEELVNNQFDIVISSLFTHHFTDENWIRLIQKMADCARKQVVINDLHRHWFAYHSIGILTSVFSKSEMVKHDSKLSVLRSFRLIELEHLLKKAGIKTFSIKWMWAFRWQVCIETSTNREIVSI
ncbi:MAG: methyltransferase domain-containing protein [Daejeonella sp.]|uniref:methyltransferase domain-containing protein n=1 Tax=Daejeonella sp. TaxID=2805397 RepID=UPI0027370BE2|nr:methyltransferase domain-containing protein [Daejeonella sp.]MDP3468348.1 methyltransferase domain-containing protein [Daejeonella sp.]